MWMLEAQPIIHPRDAPLAALIRTILSQIIKTTGSIRSIDDQTESLLMFVLTRARYSSSSASFSGSIYATVSSISAARSSVYSPSTGVKHTRCVRAASGAGALIALPINRLKSAAERAIRHL